MRCILATCVFFLAMSAPPVMVSADGADPITADQEQFFETKIRPVLAKSCYECHSGKKQQAGLRVDSREFLIKGGEGGSVLTPAKLDESRMWEVLQHDPLDTQMPPDSKLADEVLADFKAWIEMGAPWPASDQPLAGSDEQQIDWTQHWAFQPIRKPDVPAVNDQDWPHSPIDQFILAKLEQNGVAPAPAADKPTLLRRLKFDLLGLPPTREEIESFVRNDSPSAYSELVEQYLSSPHFGERWGRHWLDVSRYADTKGYVFQEDRNYPDAWRYRDWVINAFNDDMPYDRFLITQLAADKSSDKTEDLHAMGFLTLGRRFLNNSHDIIDDRLDVVFRGMMGLTVACARCHDHKYDPIPTADYYSLYGVFASSEEPKNEPSPLRLVDKDKLFEPVVFVRGQAGNRGPQVPRQFLSVIERDARQPFSEGSGRLEMAEKIASPDNPLTARVWANRVWGHLIGKELVRTPSDFGVRSDPPSHPELLDHLALLLIENEWSTKSLISEIVLSATYQQSSRSSAELSRSDPENSLLTHMNRKRVDLEGLRDAMLSAAGTLDSTMGGQSVRIENPPFPTRRTVYAFIDRQNLPGLFRTFDFAGPDTHAPRRFETNVPQQALFLMNSPFVMRQAAALAERAKRDSLDESVRALYALALARDPGPEEVSLAVEYVSQAPEVSEVAVRSSWSYGYGELDPEAGQLKTFIPLPHFTGSAWQGGGQLPDDQLGWVTLNATGGHVGNDLKHVAIRRWTAPAAGTIRIRGNLKHSTDQGDGVRGRVLLSQTDQQGVWDVHNSAQRTHLDNIEVQEGQAVDFVTDLKTNVSHDSFEWKVKVSLDATGSNQRAEYDSSAEFQGPAPEPLTPLAQLAQILLLSNEFQFID